LAPARRAGGDGPRRTAAVPAGGPGPNGRSRGRPPRAVAVVPGQPRAGRPGLLAHGRRLLLHHRPSAMNPADVSHDRLAAHLLDRLREVQRQLGTDSAACGPEVRLSDALDSMALVEYLAVLAEDLGVTSASLERCAGRRFGTVAELAAALRRSGLGPAV